MKLENLIIMQNQEDKRKDKAFKSMLMFGILVLLCYLLD